jgi:nitrogen regulatory protein PII
MHTLLHSIKSVFRKDSVNRTRVQLEQLRIYADGVRIVQGKAPEKYHRQLFGLEDRFRKKLETIEKRIVVRDKRLVLRLFAVCSLLKNGGYQHTSGIKALLRDIVG